MEIANGPLSSKAQDMNNLLSKHDNISSPSLPSLLSVDVGVKFPWSC